MSLESKARFQNKIKEMRDFFISYYKEEPVFLFSSPGRIELIGNHTDHNHGKVIVSTLDLSILALVKKTDDNFFVYKTDGFNEMRIDLNSLELRKNEYYQSIGLIRGVLFYLKEAGYKLGGVHITSSTNIFKGAGVSSSAAFEILIGKIISYCYNDDKISSIELAKIGQNAENNYFNKPCGLLDQCAISLGGVNYIDFEDENNPKIINIKCYLKKYDIVITNTLESHSSLSSYYAKIKNDMAMLSSYFQKKYLREVEYQDYLNCREDLISKYSLDVYLRGEHFFEENIRVEKALEALKNHDEDLFVKIIDESGESSFNKLKNCYVKDLNENLPMGIMLSKSINLEGGTRVHGGGFAGTFISLVKKEQTQDYLKQMRKKYGRNNVRKVTLSKFGTRCVSLVEDILKKEYLDEPKRN
ncbi:MAG: galactokinase family protein [Bacilli bacterium]|nr:galactokinase family protein [Bacillales bacterium]MDY2574742.1 galactokinase family protein [Bacilli bacterium]